VVERRIDQLKARLARADAVFAGLPARLANETARSRDRLNNIARRSDTALDIFVRREKQALAAHDRILQSLSYKNVLMRGYAVIRGEDEQVLSSASMVAEGASISVEFADGRVQAIAGEGSAAPPAPAKKKATAKGSPAASSGQGSLF